MCLSMTSLCMRARLALTWAVLLPGVWALRETRARRVRTHHRAGLPTRCAPSWPKLRRPQTAPLPGMMKFNVVMMTPTALGAVLPVPTASLTSLLCARMPTSFRAAWGRCSVLRARSSLLAHLRRRLRRRGDDACSGSAGPAGGSRSFARSGGARLRAALPTPHVAPADMWRRMREKPRRSTTAPRGWRGSRPLSAALCCKKEMGEQDKTGLRRAARLLRRAAQRQTLCSGSCDMIPSCAAP